MSDLGLQYTSPEPASPVRTRVLLGRILVNADLIDQADLVLALEHQRTINVPLGELLVAQGLITPTQVSQALAIQHQLQLVDLVADPPKPTMGKHISAQDCLRLGIVPWRSVGNIVLVATSTPDKFVQFNHDLAASGISFLPVIADERQIKQAITEVYGAELAQRAATRVPPVESCRTWRVDRRDRRAWALGVLSLLSTLIILQPAWTFTIIILWALCTSILTVSLRSLAFFARLFLCDDPPATARMTGIATGLATREKLQLPRVSVLVPLLHEKEIATALIARLTRLTYPKSLLQIVLVLEEGDAMTRETIARTTLPSWRRKSIKSTAVLSISPMRPRMSSVFKGFWTITTPAPIGFHAALQSNTRHGGV